MKKEGLPILLGRPFCFIKRQVSGSEDGRAGLASTSKAPAQSTPRPEDLRIKRSVSQPRPCFLSSTVHGAFVCGLRAAALRRLASDTRLRTQSLFTKQGPPRGLPRGERRKEWSGWSPRRQAGTEQSGISSDDMGGCNEPAIAGIQSPPRVSARRIPDEVTRRASAPPGRLPWESGRCPGSAFSSCPLSAFPAVSSSG